MNLTGVDIERIVREVVSRVRELNRSDSSAPRTAPTTVTGSRSHDSRVTNQQVSRSSPLVIHQRLITLETVEGRLDGVTRVVAPTGAVVTPSVRDELNRMEIELQFQVIHRPAETVIQTVLAATDKRLDLAPFAPANARCQVIREPCPLTIAERIGKEIETRSVQSAIVFTDRTALTMCVVNRYRTLRAVQVVDEGSVTDAIESLAANVLVINPERVATSVIRQFVDRFLHSIPADCPVDHPLLRA